MVCKLGNVVPGVIHSLYSDRAHRLKVLRQRHTEWAYSQNMHIALLTSSQYVHCAMPHVRDASILLNKV